VGSFLFENGNSQSATVTVGRYVTILDNCLLLQLQVIGVHSSKMEAQRTLLDGVRKWFVVSSIALFRVLETSNGLYLAGLYDLRFLSVGILEGTFLQYSSTHS
jgi:hypothetical protein